MVIFSRWGCDLKLDNLKMWPLIVFNIWAILWNLLILGCSLSPKSVSVAFISALLLLFGNNSCYLLLLLLLSLGHHKCLPNSNPLAVSSWFSLSSSYILSLFTHGSGESLLRVRRWCCQNKKRKSLSSFSFNISLLWKCFCWKLPRHTREVGR